MHFYYCLPYECQQIAELLVNFLKKNCLLVGFDKKNGNKDQIPGIS